MSVAQLEALWGPGLIAYLKKTQCIRKTKPTEKRAQDCAWKRLRGVGSWGGGSLWYRWPIFQFTKFCFWGAHAYRHGHEAQT